MNQPRREVVWRLREVMAERGLFMTTGIVPLLKAQGVDLSREQIYRIASGVPQRLSLDLLGALCAVLSCDPNDLIQFREVIRRRKVSGERDQGPPAIATIRPVGVQIHRPNFTDDK